MELITRSCCAVTGSKDLEPLHEVRRFPVFVGCVNSPASQDVVVSPMETRLIREARSLGLEVAPGHLMSLEQAIAQFRLYTGVVPPRALLESKMRELQAE